MGYFVAFRSVRCLCARRQRSLRGKKTCCRRDSNSLPSRGSVSKVSYKHDAHPDVLQQQLFLAKILQIYYSA